MSQVTTALETDQYAYLTTTGRVSGAPHRIEIWFVVIDAHIWVASGGGDRSDWVRNLIADETLSVEIGQHSWPATAVLHAGLGEHVARQRLAARYQGWKPGQPLSSWATESMLIEIVVSA